MNKEQALYNFWAGFGLPAYDEQSVPTGDNAPELPYITYNTITDSVENQINLNASVWYRSTSWKDVTAKAKEIGDAIGIGGKVIPIDEGYVWIMRDTPFAQRVSEPSDDMIRRIYLNIAVEYLTAN